MPSRTTGFSLAQLLWALFGCAFIAVFAQLNYDLQLGETNIPISGQSFAVILMAFVLDGYTALMAVILYLVLGAIGLPVFAEASGGWQHLSGKTGGYLFSFVVVSLIIERFFKISSCSTFLQYILWSLLATAIILSTGAAYLSSFIGLSSAVQYGVLPFIIGGILKAIGASTIAFGINRIRY